MEHKKKQVVLSPEVPDKVDRAFARRLSVLREEHGYSQEMLAKQTGLSKNSIQNFEKGRLPSGSSLRELCRTLKTSADWLLFGAQPMAAPDMGGPLRVSEGETEAMVPEDRLSVESDLVIPLADEFDNPEAYLYTLVPLAEAHLSAGGGAFVPSERAAKLMAFRKDWLNTYATSRGNVVLMFVKGDSMSPSINDGDLVMLDVGRRLIHDGGVYAIGLNDTVSLKRLELMVGGKVRVISDNRTEYPPYEVDRDDLRILGQIIWFARELIK